MSIVQVWGMDAGDFARGVLIWSALNALRPAKAAPPQTVDLTRLDLVRPYSMAAIAALGCLAKRRARLLLPSVHVSRDYVVRSRLPQFFDCPEAVSLSQSALTVPVRQLAEGDATFADEITEALAREFGDMPVGLRPLLANHLDETVRNALSHAESPIGCVVAAQVYPKRRTVEIAVLDVGQTIRTHLSRNPRHAGILSDAEAVLAATREGVSGTLPGTLNRLGEPNSGVGLFELRSYCERGGGELSIVSGEAIVVFGAEGTPIQRQFVGGFPGCLVNMQFVIP